MKIIVQHLVIVLVFMITMTTTGQVTKDSELYTTLSALDKTYFDAYNNCDLETQANMYAKDLEFYHDQGGLETDREKLIASIKNNICGKVTRTLVPESLEVHEIRDYGAVVMGFHYFRNAQEPNAPSKPSRFIGVWKKEGETYKMSRIISLH